jgi:hypothetical protein
MTSKLGTLHCVMCGELLDPMASWSGDEDMPVCGDCILADLARLESEESAMNRSESCTVTPVT